MPARNRTPPTLDDETRQLEEEFLDLLADVCCRLALLSGRESKLEDVPLYATAKSIKERLTIPYYRDFLKAAKADLELVRTLWKKPARQPGPTSGEVEAPATPDPRQPTPPA